MQTGGRTDLAVELREDFSGDDERIRGVVYIVEATLKESAAGDELTVIIAKAPCALLKGMKFPNKCVVDAEKCKKCGACMRIGCPAMTKGADGIVKIDDTMCNGCGLCQNYCKFGAICKEER